MVALIPCCPLSPQFCTILYRGVPNLIKVGNTRNLIFTSLIWIIQVPLFKGINHQKRYKQNLTADLANCNPPVNTIFLLCRLKKISFLKWVEILLDHSCFSLIKKEHVAAHLLQEFIVEVGVKIELVLGRVAVQTRIDGSLQVCLFLVRVYLFFVNVQDFFFPSKRIAREHSRATVTLLLC